MGGIGFVFPNRIFILQDNEISTVKSEIVVGTFDIEIWVQFESFNKNGKTHVSKIILSSPSTEIFCFVVTKVN